LGSNSGWEADEAFRQSRTALEKLAQLSPQAGHYSEILTALSDAIGIYQRKLCEDRRRMTSQYMDQIFTAPADKPAEVPSLPLGIPSNESMPSIGTEPWCAMDDLEAGNLGEYNMMSGPYGTMISEGFPWPADDFQIDWQTYASFLDENL
jgi:hypothetical protein